MQASKTVAPGLCVAALGLTLGLSAPAQAQQVSTLGSFQDWTAYTMTENGQKVCYIASQPKKDEGNYKKRGDIYALITHRPGQNQFSVVTIYAGYQYGPGATVALDVDKNSYQLFTEGETAWAHDDTDKKIVQDMRRGTTMVVKGTSSRGTRTTDTYSLRGVTAALQAIDKACNAK